MENKEQEIRVLFGKTEQKPEEREVSIGRSVKDENGKVIGHALFSYTETELMKEFLEDGMTEAEARKKVDAMMEI